MGVLSKIPQIYLCYIEGYVMGIAFAPYINFSRSTQYEIDCLPDLVIYEKDILNLGASAL